MYWWNCRVYGQIINYINISQQRYLVSHWLQNNKFQLVPSDQTKLLIFFKSHVKRLYWTNSQREMYPRYGWSRCIEWPFIGQCKSMVTWLSTGGLNSNWEWNLCHWLKEHHSYIFSRFEIHCHINYKCAYATYLHYYLKH